MFEVVTVLETGSATDHVSWNAALKSRCSYVNGQKFHYTHIGGFSLLMPPLLGNLKWHQYNNSNLGWMTIEEMIFADGFGIFPRLTE